MNPQQPTPNSPIQAPGNFPSGQPVVANTAAQKTKGGAKSNPNSTQNVLEIAEIRDGIVIMNDGSFRAVVMAKSINYDLMSTTEQEAVEFAYQGFLNSLDSPIQICIRTQRVDIQPYIDRLDKIRSEHDNMLLAMMMEDYISYIEQLSQQTNIMDKKFYIVIPFYHMHGDESKSLAQSKSFVTGLAQLFSHSENHVVVDENLLETAKTELRNRVQGILGALNQAGITGLPLDTQELIELYYETYNPDTAPRQELQNINDMTADVITKGSGVATQPHLQRELQ